MRTVGNGTKLTGVEQASRLLFPLKAGSRDGRPTSKPRLKLVRSRANSLVRNAAHAS